MQHAMNGWLNTPRAWAADLAACLVVGAVLGVVGPFGSFFNDALPLRLAYWMSVCLVSGLGVGLAARLIWPVARRRGVPVWIWVPAAALLLSLPVGLIARLIAVAFWPGIRDAVGLLEWFGQALLIQLVYMTLYVAAHARRVGGGVPAKAETPEGGSRILDRLPPHLGRDLLCLQMEDHYVRLHTPEGSVLVLCPLSRAIEQVGDLEGMRVHRSWWVARHAVKGVVHEGRNLRLTLAGGLEAPVARAKVAELKAAGWLG